MRSFYIRLLILLAGIFFSAFSFAVSFTVQPAYTSNRTGANVFSSLSDLCNAVPADMAPVMGVSVSDIVVSDCSVPTGTATVYIYGSYKPYSINIDYKAGSCPANSALSSDGSSCVCNSGLTDTGVQCVDPNTQNVCKNQAGTTTSELYKVGWGTYYTDLSGKIGIDGGGSFTTISVSSVPSSICFSGCTAVMSVRNNDYVDTLGASNGSVVPIYENATYTFSGDVCTAANPTDDIAGPAPATPATPAASSASDSGGSTSTTPSAPASSASDSGSSGSSSTAPAAPASSASDSGGGTSSSGTSSGGSGTSTSGSGTGSSGSGSGTSSSGSSGSGSSGSGSSGSGTGSTSDSSSDKCATNPMQSGCGGDASAPGTLYTPKGKTVTDVLTGARDQLMSSGVGTSVSNFFTVPSGGSCPSYTTTIPLINAKLDFSVFCSDFFLNALLVLRTVVLVCASFFAFRVAIDF